MERLCENEKTTDNPLFNEFTQPNDLMLCITDSDILWYRRFSKRWRELKPLTCGCTVANIVDREDSENRSAQQNSD